MTAASPDARRPKAAGPVNETPSPERLIAEADRLLATVIPTTRGRWPRTCAFLLRVALEAALDRLWAGVAPRVAECPMRAQLLVLPEYVEGALAHQTAHTWAALSRAAHHHRYELAPTATELRTWQRSVRQLVEAT